MSIESLIRHAYHKLSMGLFEPWNYAWNIILTLSLSITVLRVKYKPDRYDIPCCKSDL